MNIIPWRNKKRSEDELAPSLTTFRREMDSLFDRFFGDPWGGLREFGLGGGPTMDVAETEDEVTLKFELPGVSPEDIEVNVSGSVLTLTGEKREQHEDKRENCCYSERSFGRFSRSVQLPGTVDPGKVDASFKNGVLTVTIEKHPEAKPKRIAVRNA